MYYLYCQYAYFININILYYTINALYFIVYSMYNVNILNILLKYVIYIINILLNKIEAYFSFM